MKKYALLLASLISTPFTQCNALSSAENALLGLGLATTASPLLYLLAKKIAKKRITQKDAKVSGGISAAGLAILLGLGVNHLKEEGKRKHQSCKTIVNWATPNHITGDQLLPSSKTRKPRDAQATGVGTPTTDGQSASSGNREAALTARQDSSPSHLITPLITAPEQLSQCVIRSADLPSSIELKKLTGVVSAISIQSGQLLSDGKELSEHLFSRIRLPNYLPTAFSPKQMLLMNFNNQRLLILKGNDEQLLLFSIGDGQFYQAEQAKEMIKGMKENNSVLLAFTRDEDNIKKLLGITHTTRPGALITPPAPAAAAAGHDNGEADTRPRTLFDGIFFNERDNERLLDLQEITNSAATGIHEDRFANQKITGVDKSVSPKHALLTPPFGKSYILLIGEANCQLFIFNKEKNTFEPTKMLQFNNIAPQEILALTHNEEIIKRMITPSKSRVSR